MIDFVHPALLFILGAVPIPFLKGSIRKAYLVLVPALAIVAVLTMEPGNHGAGQFIGQEILFAKVDKLSIVFATVFTIMALIGTIYALHLPTAGQHVAAFVYVGGALGVVGVPDRRAENGEDRVADELVDGAAVRDDDLCHVPEVVVEDLHDAGGIATLGEARVAAQIGHEDGDLALVAAEPQPVRRLQHRLGNLRRYVAAKRVANEVSLAQSLDHLVERACEHADLIARNGLYARLHRIQFSNASAAAA